MEFWIGISIGMHLGRVLSEHLESYIKTNRLLPSSKLIMIEKMENVENKMGKIFDAVVK